MTKPPTPQIRDFARRLIVQEAALARGPKTGVSMPPFRVCEKLRSRLTMLAGATGFQSLMSRALTLAKQESPTLRGVQVNPDGSLTHGEMEPDLDKENAEGGVLLVAYLLGLLFTFIGETLTLHLVQDVWPNVSFEGQDQMQKADMTAAEGTGDYGPQR